MSRFLGPSLIKKLVMSLAGLFLMIFLLLHLTLNLFILRSDNGELYSTCVKFMTTNFLVKIMEIVLFGGLFLHILYGIVVQIQNWLSRPVRYKVTHQSQTSFFSKYMIHTGAIIFAFLAIHLTNFYFVKLGFSNAPQGAMPVAGREDFYHMAINLFSHAGYCWLYIAFMVFIAFHMNHAFQSAFQTLGWNHPIYTPFIKAVGVIYSYVIGIGFSIVPIYFLFFK